jgi:hypothetical protein
MDWEQWHQWTRERWLPCRLPKKDQRPFSFHSFLFLPPSLPLLSLSSPSFPLFCIFSFYFFLKFFTFLLLPVDPGKPCRWQWPGGEPSNHSCLTEKAEANRNWAMVFSPSSINFKLPFPWAIGRLKRIFRFNMDARQRGNSVLNAPNLPHRFGSFCWIHLEFPLSWFFLLVVWLRNNFVSWEQEHCSLQHDFQIWCLL